MAWHYTTIDLLLTFLCFRIVIGFIPTLQLMPLNYERCISDLNGKLEGANKRLLTSLSMKKKRKRRAPRQKDEAGRVIKLGPDTRVPLRRLEPKGPGNLEYRARKIYRHTPKTFRWPKGTFLRLHFYSYYPWPLEVIAYRLKHTFHRVSQATLVGPCALPVKKRR